MKTTNLEIVSATGLSEDQLKLAVALQEQCPAIVAAVREVSQFEAGLRDKYFALCTAIRETQIPVVEGATRTLNRREVTLLLRSLGYTKQRVTEINRVVEVSDEVWQKFKQKELGFRAVLSIARAAPEQEEQLTDVTPEGDQPGVAPVAPKPKPKLPVAVEDAIAHAIVEKGAKVKVTPGDDGYEMTVKAFGKTFLVRIFVDKA